MYPHKTKTLQISHISPSPVPSQHTTLKSLPLTFLDVPWLNFPPTQRLLFYRIPENHTFHVSILPNLKKSLGTALGHFLPLSGTFTWPPHADEPFVDIDPDTFGVSLTIAESEADFCKLSSDDPRQPEESKSLLPHHPGTRTETPVAALQVTYFPNGNGFAIGISTQHAIVDGKTSAMFLKSWAFISKFGSDPPNELLPEFDRTVIPEPVGTKAALLEQRALRMQNNQVKTLICMDFKGILAGGDRLQGSFVLSKRDVESLRSKIQSNWSGRVKFRRVSTFAVACSYAWYCLVRSGKFSDETIHFLLAADCRSRLVPPVPNNYFGNCLSGIVGSCKRAEVALPCGYMYGAAAVSESIDRLREEGVPDKKEDWVIIDKLSRGGTAMSVAGSPRFGLYGGCDFGWGTPVKVEVASIDGTGAIGLSESQDGEGVEIQVVLEREQMGRFKDAFIKVVPGRFDSVAEWFSSNWLLIRSS